MRFSTIISSAALATTALAMPTNEWAGEGYGGHGKKHEHEVSPVAPVAPEYHNNAPVEVSPVQPAPANKDHKKEVKPETPVEVSPVAGTSPSYKDGNTVVSPVAPVQHSGDKCPAHCLNDHQAQQGAEIFRQLIQNYSDDLALKALTPDFEDYTSSVNIIRNKGNRGPIEVNGISFVSRDDFMAAQGSQPQIPFDTLNVFHGCDSITVRWQTTDSARGKETRVDDIPAPGLALIHTVPATDNEYGFRIRTLYSEFNAAVWLVNLGVFRPDPNAERTKRDLISAI